MAKKRAAPMSLSYLRTKQGFNAGASDTSSISSQCHPTELSKHDDTIDRTVALRNLQTDSSKRLKKQSGKIRPFSEKELANLSDGVMKYGKIWARILMRYDFHKTRSAGDLRLAYLAIKRYTLDRSQNVTQEWSDTELNQLKLCVINHDKDCSSCCDGAHSLNDLRNKKKLVKKYHDSISTFRL